MCLTHACHSDSIQFMWCDVMYGMKSSEEQKKQQRWQRQKTVHTLKIYHTTIPRAHSQSQATHCHSIDFDVCLCHCVSSLKHTQFSLCAKKRRKSNRMSACMCVYVYAREWTNQAAVILEFCVWACVCAVSPQHFLIYNCMCFDCCTIIYIFHFLLLFHRSFVVFYWCCVWECVCLPTTQFTAKEVFVPENGIFGCFAL